MIFIDSNIPMYLVGRAHSLKAVARRRLEELIAGAESLVTDAEVFQEILHRYAAIDRPEAIEPAFSVLMETVDEVFPIEVLDVVDAKLLMKGDRRLSARDAVHLAIMRRHGIRSIFSFDSGFDGARGVVRIGD